MNRWKLKNKIVSFPKEWDKKRILRWVNNNGAIRICPICDKLDVSYDHFNNCNPSEQAAVKANRDMSQM